VCDCSATLIFTQPIFKPHSVGYNAARLANMCYSFCLLIDSSEMHVNKFLVQFFVHENLGMLNDNRNFDYRIK